MGMKRPSTSSYPTERIVRVDKNPNPDPKKWKIIKYQHFGYNGDFLVVEMNYPDCTNYEGNKILLYENVTINQLKGQRYIDPHFSTEGIYKSPIARFIPTDRGWNMAKSLAEAMSQAKNK
jgi:hypothetical protein